MEKNSRKDSFDVVKCFAAFFVVQLHTIPATVCPLLNVIARLAVPLFFLNHGLLLHIYCRKRKIWSATEKDLFVGYVFLQPLLFIVLIH